MVAAIINYNPINSEQRYSKRLEYLYYNNIIQNNYCNMALNSSNFKGFKTHFMYLPRLALAFDSANTRKENIRMHALVMSIILGLEYFLHHLGFRYYNRGLKI